MAITIEELWEYWPYVAMAGLAGLYWYFTTNKAVAVAPPTNQIQNKHKLMPVPMYMLTPQPTVTVPIISKKI